MRGKLDAGKVIEHYPDADAVNIAEGEFILLPSFTKTGKGVVVNGDRSFLGPVLSNGLLSEGVRGCICWMGRIWVVWVNRISKEGFRHHQGDKMNDGGESSRWLWSLPFSSWIRRITPLFQILYSGTKELSIIIGRNFLKINK